MPLCHSCISHVDVSFVSIVVQSSLILQYILTELKLSENSCETIIKKQLQNIQHTLGSKFAVIK